MKLFGEDTSFVGIDIGSTAIRMVELRRGHGAPSLVAYGSVEVPANVAASDAKADQDKIVELLKQLLKQNNVAVKTAVVGLPSAKVFATVITTPKLSPAELAKAVRFQAEQYVPMDVSQVKLDHAVLGQSADGSQLEVLLIAAPNSASNKYLSILEAVGMEPVALEANSIAAARALMPHPPADGVVLIDFGSLDADIGIFLDGTPRLMRSVPVGEQVLVRAVAQNLGLNEVQAEQFTYKFGLTQSKLEGQVYKALKGTLDTLVAEIEKSVKFFNGRYPGVKLEKLVITGRMAALPELAPYIANATGMPVEFGNAWSGVNYPQSEGDKLLSVSGEYAAAVGLAGRGMLS